MGGVAVGLSARLDESAMPNARKSAAAHWICTRRLVGRFRPFGAVHAYQLAVWLFGSNVTDHTAINDLCLDTASRSPELESARRAFAFVLDHDHGSWGILGGHAHCDRVDACESLAIGAPPRHAARGRLRAKSNVRPPLSVHSWYPALTRDRGASIGDVSGQLRYIFRAIQ